MEIIKAARRATKTAPAWVRDGDAIEGVLGGQDKKRRGPARTHQLTAKKSIA
jgi:hypothetical protein